jgi:hypothetical protein
MTKQPCAICGVRPATTQDHVPPAGIFLKPRPSDLVTVPCCRECNVEGSKWDEPFRVYLAMHVSRHDSEWQRRFDAQVLPTARHNRKLQRKILESAEHVLLRTAAGILLGPAVSIQWDSEAHDRVVERIVRGLHFRHTGEILGGDAKVRVHFFETLNNVAPTFEQFPLWGIGDGQVLYKIIHHPDLPLRSAWVFQFQGWLWSGAGVIPADEDWPA